MSQEQPTPEESRKPQVPSLRIVFEFWRQRPGWIIALVAGTLFATAVTIAFPYVLRLIVDGIESGTTVHRLAGYVIMLVGFGILRAAGDVMLPYSRGRINELYQWKVRSEVFSRVLNMGHTFTNKFPTGDVMERLDHDMAELSWFACSGIFRFVAAAFTLIFGMIMMVTMNPFLTLVTVLPTSIGAFIWMRFSPLVMKWFMKWREAIAEINNQLQSAFSGIRLVKAYVMEQKLAGRFRSTLDGRVDVAVNEARVEARIRVLYMGIAEIATLLVLWVGGVLVMGRHLTLGEFVAFNAYIIMLIGPMFDIGNLFVSGRRAQGAAQRIQSIRNHPFEVQPPERPVAPEPGELRLQGVTFAYDSRPALKDLTMSFEPGRKIGIAGTIGSGKSSLFRLLFRMADPQSGVVTLSGRDVRTLDLDAYRRVFGYAPQEPMLFSDTIRQNVIFGRENVDETGLQRVVAGSELAKDVAGFPKGLDEVLGERGTGLSGGQKERVAIARALINQPAVMVFDDATSALDAETERDLVNRLINELKETTAIIVSHRLSVLSACDLVYVLDAGELKEQGTHEELLARRGLYWKLYQRQLIEQELEEL